MENKVIPGVLGVFVVICLVGGMLVPIIDGMAGGEPGQINEGAGWIRMNYDTSASTYSITIAPADDGVSVTNGTDTQTGADDTIFYADSNVAVWMQDGTINVLGQNTDGPQFFQPLDPVTITRTADSVAIDDGSTTLTFGTPAWAYVPISSGNYGYFEDGTAVSTNSPIAAVGGGFAGVYAYNDIARYDGLGLKLQTVIEDDKLTGAYWAKPAAADSLSITPFDPGSITIQPLDPSVLDPEPDVSIMSVPTPTYTDGEWGYDIIQVDGVDKAAIVSYSGAGGDIVVPSTVGGYDVYRFGKIVPSAVTGNNNVIDNNSISSDSTLTISQGIVEIGRYALSGCNKLISVSIPDSVIAIGGFAFDGCSGLSGSLILTNSVTSIYGSAFRSCGFDGTLLLPDSITDVRSSAFSSANFTYFIVLSDAIPANNTALAMSNLTEVLDLSDTVDYSVDRYGIPAAATVQDNIGDSAGYISFVKTEGSGSGFSDSVKGLMLAIPIVIFAACIAVGAAVYLKRE